MQNWIDTPARHFHLMPNRLAHELSAGVRVVNDAQKFAVQMDTSQYQPEEIDVKVNNAEQGRPAYLTVSGKHEEKQDEHGYVSRSFTRRYALPPDVDAAQLACNMSETGVLTAQAPKVQPALADGARAIPITHVAQAPKLGAAAKANKKSANTKDA